MSVSALSASPALLSFQEDFHIRSRFHFARNSLAAMQT
jgi:hypothetical protein